MENYKAIKMCLQVLYKLKWKNNATHFLTKNKTQKTLMRFKIVHVI